MIDENFWQKTDNVCQKTLSTDNDSSMFMEIIPIDKSYVPSNALPMNAQPPSKVQMANVAQINVPPSKVLMSSAPPPSKVLMSNAPPINVPPPSNVPMSNAPPPSKVQMSNAPDRKSVV